MAPSPNQIVETPSGKDVAYENFPVGSWLLPAAARPHIAVFYAFARAADDIADNPQLPPDEKVARLNSFEDVLLGRDAAKADIPEAARMRHSLGETGVSAQHCVDLLAAFKMDATKLRYDDWDELMGYCTLSAAPVGRFLLDLHGGSRLGYEASDALCAALQVINHLQDCKDDYLTLDRVYLPQDWMANSGVTVEDLGGTETNASLRGVMNRALDATAELLLRAQALPSGLISRRLAMESGAILTIADRLVGRLRREDPLASRVELSKSGYLWCCALGAIKALV